MLFYTKKQHESAIDDTKKQYESTIDDIIDSFRGIIIEQLETIAKSEGYKEKYELLLRKKNEGIEMALRTSSKHMDEIFKKYDLCFWGKDMVSQNLGTCWIELNMTAN